MGFSWFEGMGLRLRGYRIGFLGQRLAGDQTAEEVVAGQALDAVDFEGFFATVQQPQLRLRVVLPEGLETAQIRRTNGGGALDLQSPETVPAVDDEVHFGARFGPPEAQGGILSRIVDPGAQVLGDE